MRPKIHIFVFSLLLPFGVMADEHKRLDQNSPSQFSPAIQDYATPLQEHLSRNQKFAPLAIPKNGSAVALSWKPIADAIYYFVIVSADPELKDIVYTQNTTEKQVVTTELSPGQYYYRVRGYKGTRMVGESDLDRFVIGSPLQIGGESRENARLAAPQITGPEPTSEFPSYSPVRLSWTKVAGARGYRFRLWEVKEKQQVRRKSRKAFSEEIVEPELPEGPPRWVTEVPENWIEVRDAPYSSFMYLDSGTYRWDVAAVDSKKGRVGETASSTFQVNRQLHLKEVRDTLRLTDRFFPNAQYKQTSATTGLTFQKSIVKNLIHAEWDHFFKRQLGFRAGFGLETYSQTTFLIVPDLAAEILYQTHTSARPDGWNIYYHGGLQFFNFPLQENPDAGITQTLSAFGIKGGVDFENVSDLFVFQTGLGLMLPLALSVPNYSESSLYPTLNYSAYIRGLFSFSNQKWAFGPEASLQHRNLKFATLPNTPNTNVSWQNSWSLGMVLQHSF